MKFKYRLFLLFYTVFLGLLSTSNAQNSDSNLFVTLEAKNISLVGDSAGGGLVMALLQILSKEYELIKNILLPDSPYKFIYNKGDLIIVSDFSRSVFFISLKQALLNWNAGPSLFRSS